MWAVGVLRVVHHRAPAASSSAAANAPAPAAALLPAALWAAGCRADAAFPARYTVYHFLRSRGWVLRAGISCGCDWLAYRLGGPRAHHAACAVTAAACIAETLAPIVETAQRRTWRAVAGAVRAAEQVRKENVVCTVLVPAALVPVLASAGPHCLPQLRVHSLMARRFVP